MKPHLRIRFGVWHCRRPALDEHFGLGFTLAEAYDDWWAENLRRNGGRPA